MGPQLNLLTVAIRKRRKCQWYNYLTNFTWCLYPPFPKANLPYVTSVLATAFRWIQIYLQVALNSTSHTPSLFSVYRFAPLFVSVYVTITLTPTKPTNSTTASPPRPQLIPLFLTSKKFTWITKQFTKYLLIAWSSIHGWVHIGDKNECSRSSLTCWYC